MNFELLNYISLDNELVEKLTDLAQKDEVSILSLSEKFFKGNASCVSGKNPIIKLAVVLKAAEKTLTLYRKAGISDEVFKETFSDIKIWCENCDNKGLANTNWLKNHVHFELFRLGRLQFQLFTCFNPMLNYFKLPFSRNDKLIYVHIPQGEKLDYDECVKSICYADAFFKEYFPDYSYDFYFCESWLLFQNNRRFMSEKSNIARFMSLFDIHYSVFEESQAFERIFNSDINFKSIIYKLNKSKRKSDVKRLPESTSLQRNAKEYLLNGNKLGVGIGTIPKSKYNTL